MCTAPRMQRPSNKLDPLSLSLPLFLLLVRLGPRELHVVQDGYVLYDEVKEVKGA